MDKVLNRFRDKITYQNGCWLWTGSITKRGYGRFRYKGETRLAHRIAYELFIGPTPQGELDHVCHSNSNCSENDNCIHRRCVNPVHLEPVDRVENNQRSNSPSAINILKTHCINGHEFTPKNTYVRTTGHRACRKCTYAKTAAWNRKKRLLMKGSNR